MGTREGCSFLLLGAVILGYIIARAVLVPFVHDEAATYSMYVQMGEWLPWRSHWDAGNHFLSTGLGIIADRVFGMEQWVLRGASVLAYVLYALIAWRVGGHVKDKLVRWCSWSGLLLCPFVLEFFSLFRGYGPALAFLMLGLDGLLRLVRSGNVWSASQALVGFALANACILSLLTLWLVALPVIAWLMLTEVRTNAQRTRRIMLWSALGFVPFVFALRVSREMQAAGLFYYGSLDGFMDVTLRTLCGFVLGSGDAWVMGIVLVLLASVTSVAVHLWWRSGSWCHPLVVCAGLLWADVLSRILMARLLGVNYPEDRAALHMVPLFIIALALALDVLAVHNAPARYGAFLLLYLPLRTLATINTTHTSLWPDESPPARFIQRMDELQKQQGRPLLIGAYRQMNRSLPFAAGQHEVELPMPLTEGFPSGPHDVRIARPDHIAAASAGYRILDHDPGTGLTLLQRERPLPLFSQPLVQQPSRTTSDEFIGVLDSDTLQGGTDHLVEVSGRLTTDGPAQVKLVVEVRNRADSVLYYDAIMVTAFAPPEHSFTEVRHVPHLRHDQRVVVYFWNMRKAPLRIDDCALRVRVVLP